MNKLSIRDLQLSGKRVFVRADFNVPLENGKVADDTRIRETLPTLKLARERGARLVLASHLGRPKGKPEEKYSLRPVAWKLADLLGSSVEFATDCVGAEAEAKSQGLGNGAVLLLENVRFHREEEARNRPPPRGRSRSRVRPAGPGRRSRKDRTVRHGGETRCR